MKKLRLYLDTSVISHLDQEKTATTPRAGRENNHEPHRPHERENPSPSGPDSYSLTSPEVPGVVRIPVNALAGYAVMW